MAHDIRFEWDPAKAVVNARKHGVTFEEAQTAFFDDLALVIETRNTRTSRQGSSCWV